MVGCVVSMLKALGFSLASKLGLVVDSSIPALGRMRLEGGELKGQPGLQGEILSQAKQKSNIKSK